MWKSNCFGPGAKACSKTAFGIQSICSGAKPMAFAIAYAVAPSKPSMEYGSLTSQSSPPAGSFGYWTVGSPPHHGGKAGLSVLNVSRPGVLVERDSIGPQTAMGLGSTTLVGTADGASADSDGVTDATSVASGDAGSEASADAGADAGVLASVDAEADAAADADGA